MDIQELRNRARRARDQSTRERFQLFEAVLAMQTHQAEDRITQRIRVALEELEKRAQQAAERGQDAAILVRLSSQLYDLRQAVLEELNNSAQRDPDPYPQLRKQGPFAFRHVDKWLRSDLQWNDPEHTSPLPWLDKLARWLHNRAHSRGLTKLLQGGPPLQGPVQELFAECKRRGLKPVFEFYDQLEDKGIALKVSW